MYRRVANKKMDRSAGWLGRRIEEHGRRVAMAETGKMKKAVWFAIVCGCVLTPAFTSPDVQHMRARACSRVPAPGVLLLSSLGAGAMGWMRRRRVISR
jgi:hypothetical protein